MKDVNDLMQTILEMDAAQRKATEKAKLERTARLAALDGLYLAPWARGGLFALRLLRHAESALAGRGVSLVQYSSPASRPCHALYRRLGAQPTETIWHKTLPPAPARDAETIQEDS